VAAVEGDYEGSLVVIVDNLWRTTKGVIKNRKSCELCHCLGEAVCSRVRQLTQVVRLPQLRAARAIIYPKAESPQICSPGGGGGQFQHP
jgi:hypothetical protein